MTKPQLRKVSQNDKFQFEIYLFGISLVIDTWTLEFHLHPVFVINPQSLPLSEPLQASFHRSRKTSAHLQITTSFPFFLRLVLFPELSDSQSPSAGFLHPSLKFPSWQYAPGIQYFGNNCILLHVWLEFSGPNRVFPLPVLIHRLK